jgi:hypothetical protein
MPLKWIKNQSSVLLWTAFNTSPSIKVGGGGSADNFGSSGPRCSLQAKAKHRR